jgi:hypothetical protein
MTRPRTTRATSGSWRLSMRKSTSLYSAFANTQANLAPTVIASVPMMRSRLRSCSTTSRPASSGASATATGTTCPTRTTVAKLAVA